MSPSVLFAIKQTFMQLIIKDREFYRKPIVLKSSVTGLHSVQMQKLQKGRREEQGKPR